MASEDPKVYLAQRGSPWRWVILGVLSVLLLMFAGTAFLIHEIWTHRAELVQKVSAPQPPLPILETMPAVVAAPAAPAAAPDSILGRIDAHRLLHLPLLNSFEDVSAQKHAMTPSGSVNATPQGARFSGTGWLVAPHIAFDNRPFAIALWVRPLSKVMNMGLLEQFDQNKKGRYLHLMLRDPDSPRCGFMMEDLQTDKPVTMELGWTHLVFQYTGWKQEVWMNGQLIGARQCVAYKGETGATMIGKTPQWGDDPPTQNFRGLMRDLRVYDMALSAEQIGALSHLTFTAAPATTPNQDNEHHNDAF